MALIRSGIEDSRFRWCSVVVMILQFAVVCVVFLRLLVGSHGVVGCDAVWWVVMVWLVVVVVCGGEVFALLRCVVVATACLWLWCVVVVVAIVRYNVVGWVKSVCDQLFD